MRAPRKAECQVVLGLREKVTSSMDGNAGKTLTVAPWLVLTALVLILGFAFQGSRGLWSPDEGRYAECAREMLVSGDWMTPRLSGSIHFTKPPLTYWAIALGLRLWGMNEWGVRFYLVLAFCATALLVFAFGVRIWDRTTGFLAGLIYATMVFPFASANVVTTDTLLTVWITFAFYCFWRGWCSPSRRHGYWWIAGMWGGVGAAFLTKGPVGLFPLAVAVVFLVVQRGLGRGRTRLVNLSGLLLFVVIGLTWYLYVVSVHEGLLPYLLKSEVIGRVGGAHARNPEWYKGFVIYPPAILLAALPWTLAWPFLWVRWSGGSGWRDRMRKVRHSPRLVLLGVWVALPLLIFVVIPSRLAVYVLPLFPPLALATARGLVLYVYTSDRACSFWSPKRIAVLVAVWALILLSAKMAAKYVPSKWDDRTLWNNIQRRLKSDEVTVIGGNARRHGVTFYSNGAIEMLEWGHRLPPPLSAQENVLGKSITELARSRRPYAVLTRTRHRRSLRRFATRPGYRSSVIAVDQDHILILCRPIQRGKRK